jgi:hypothetical protein
MKCFCYAYWEGWQVEGRAGEMGFVLLFNYILYIYYNIYIIYNL